MIKVGWIPRNFKISILICHFCRKIINMITRVNSRIVFELTSFIRYFHEKFEKSYIRWTRKYPRIQPSYYLSDFPENDNLGLKMKILKFLGIELKKKVRLPSFILYPSNNENIMSLFSAMWLTVGYRVPIWRISIFRKTRDTTFRASNSKRFKLLIRSF